jgi:hypothetical protein
VHQAQASQPDHLCRSCGTPVAHDHATDLFCSACQRARRRYDPRHDPHFPEALLELLTAPRRRPVSVYRELGIEHCGLVTWGCVRVHVVD